MVLRLVLTRCVGVVEVVAHWTVERTSFVLERVVQEVVLFFYLLLVILQIDF